jgi:YidC/Oxa1 family membrane protein insertase
VFDVFFDFFATLLSFFYELIPDYGIGIVLLTVAVMLLVTPLTLKGTRSMMELQMHQPELRRIQTEFRDDRQKMNEELMKFYAEHGVNPVGGCLPMLIQLPVFIILYNVVQGLTRRTSMLDGVLTSGDGGLAGTFDPKYLDQTSRLYEDLHESREMVAFGIDLARTPVQAMGEGLVTALPYLLLVIGIAVTSYVQQKQIQGRSSGQINPQMQMITRIMPIMFVFFSLNFPAALAVYWCTSGLWRIGQQYLIGKHIYTDEAKERLEAARAKSAITTTGKDAGAAGAPAPGGFLGKLLGGAQPNLPQSGGGATQAKAKGGTATKTNVATASPKQGAGRVTPPGSRPAASRKKKKRK